MGFFSGGKKSVPTVDDLVEVYGTENIRKLTKKQLHELQNKLEGKPLGKKGAGGDIRAILKDTKQGRSGQGGVGKMPKGPVDEKGKPRSSWW